MINARPGGGSPAIRISSSLACFDEASPSSSRRTTTLCHHGRSGDHGRERLRIDLGASEEIEVEVARSIVQMRVDQRPDCLILLEVIRAMEIKHATERLAQRR